MFEKNLLFLQEKYEGIFVQNGFFLGWKKGEGLVFQNDDDFIPFNFIPKIFISKIDYFFNLNMKND